MYSVLNHVQCNILFDYAHGRIALYFHYFMIARCFISILLDALLCITLHWVTISDGG